MTNTIQAKAWLALLGRVNQWTETPVMLPDTVFNPGADKAWIGFSPVGMMPVDRGVQYDCGNEFTGFLNVSVMVPTRWTYASHAGLAGRVCDHFGYGSRYSYDDCVVTIHNRPFIDGAPRLDSSWNRLDVSVRWRAWG